jgi:hypothetical protein
MKIMTIILLTAIIVFTSGCKDPTSSNSLSGSWNFLFDGDYGGGGTATIDGNGKITISANLVNTAPGLHPPFQVTISGTVDNSGNLTAKMSRTGDDNFGIMNGSISGVYGHGIDKVSPSSSYGSWSGTWTATKN